MGEGEFIITILAIVFLCSMGYSAYIITHE